LLNNKPYEALKEQIIVALTHLPAGFATSYGDVALRAGLPRYHRLVARVLRDLPNNSQIAWYRVMTACRRPAFEPGSAAFKRQQQALASEGVLLENGRVPLAQWLPAADGVASTRSTSRSKANKSAISLKRSR
jgi:methylated-DNA-protein-cysteine methyltransferase-like protein